MSGDIEKKASAERTSGRLIDVEVEVPVDEMMSRHAETFVPEQDDALDEAPESITAGELLPNVAAYSGISLDALPVRGLKLFVYLQIC